MKTLALALGRPHLAVVGKRRRPNGGKFSETITEAICRHLIEGKSLRAICRRSSMPSVATVMRWLREPDKAAFAHSYAVAREFQAERLFDEIMEIADSATPSTVKADRLRIEARMWYISKLAPRKYGKRPVPSHSGETGSRYARLTLGELGRRMEEARA